MNGTLRLNAHQLKVINHRVGIVASATGGVGRTSAILTGRHLIRNIANLFRAVEFLLCLAMISRLSLNLPLALSLSHDFLCDLTVSVVSPRFGFVLGNAIVLTLFLKAGHRRRHSGHHFTILQHNPSPNHAAGSKPSLEGAIVTGIFSSSVSTSTPVSKNAGAVSASPSLGAEEVMRKSCYRRSKSEKSLAKRERLRSGGERKGNGDDQLELRRSKTEIRLGGGDACACEAGRERRVKADGEKKGEVHYTEDHLNSEEFRRTVEDFIARQQRFLREEEREEVGILGG